MYFLRKVFFLKPEIKGKTLKNLNFPTPGTPRYFQRLHFLKINLDLSALYRILPESGLLGAANQAKSGKISMKSQFAVLT